MANSNEFTIVTPPNVTGPLPVSEDSYPFSTMRKARVPLDLAEYGFLEEEYLLSGHARKYQLVEGAAEPIETREYCTRVLVRRPAEAPSDTAWVSVLNASQGYDIEDDWRRAWDHIISKRETYVGVSSKPIQASALQTFDPDRYADLSWGGKPPQIQVGPDWNPFMVIDECEEGLVWDIMAQAAAWLRSGDSFQAPDYLFMMGQSQSSVYTNTYLTYFHDLLKLEGGRNPYDGYLPGVGSCFVRTLNQDEDAPGGLSLAAPGSDGKQAAFTPILVDPVELDVPIISITSEGDTQLFPGGPDAFRLGDGPMRRHWHVAGAPHSDPRSRVIPANSEVERSGRNGRHMDQQYLERLSAFPIEPLITGAMVAIQKWVRDGVPAAPSKWFEAAAGDFVRDEDGVIQGGVRMGLIEEPLGTFIGASPENPVMGHMSLNSREDVLERYSSLKAYQAACDEVDDKLEAQGYLEVTGRRLLHAVEKELWGRIVDGEPAPVATPQSVAE